MEEDIKTPPVTSSRDEVSGITVGRFAISHRLGAGGMGQVYSAEDTTLKRRVAIKRMTPGGKSSEEDRKRLLKEAQRSSALNHPNIGSIHDVVEHAGELWLVMEYVEGVTLRRRLKQLGKQPFSRDEFFAIASQCCEGLQAAHEKGIIHGDIKPENIMLTPGNRVKILDFGVARRMWQAAKPDDVTSSLETMKPSGGTPAYMAPEVLLQKQNDGRSDLFSLGLVFYEMLGGEQPFHSDSIATTVAKIVQVNPPPLKNVPQPLAKIINRAIAKNPDARYPNAGAVLEDLHRVQHGGSPRRDPAASNWHQSRILAALAIAAVLVAGSLIYRSVRRSTNSASTSAPAQTTALPQTKILAVLPFSPPANADPKLAALGEGVVTNLAAKLSDLTEDRAFEVVTAQYLRDRKITTLPDAARNFGANLGLIVTLEPQPSDQIKVTYSVLNAQSGASLSSNTVTVAAVDVFSLEQRIALGIVKDLRLQLRPDEESALQYHGTDNPAAYQFYLQAQGYLQDHTKAENIDNAIAMAREALKLDPNFGMAKALLGESYWFMYSTTKQNQWITLAKTNCDEAIKLGNAAADGHICLGQIDNGLGKYPEAASEFQLALGLEPANEESALSLALALQHDGKVNEAEKAYQRAIQTHPNSRIGYATLGAFYQARNEHEKALEMYDKVTQIAPEWYVAYVNIGSVYYDTGQYEKDIAASQKSITLRPTYAGYVNLGAAYFGLQKFSDAAAAYQEAAKLDPQQYVIWGNLGDALYQSGNKAEAAAPLRKAVELCSAQLKVNPHDSDVLSSLAGYYSELGDAANARKYLADALRYGANDKDVLIDAASVYNRLGESGLAVEWLGKAVRAGYTADKIRSLHEFDNLASTPGYQQLMKAK